MGGTIPRPRVRVDSFLLLSQRLRRGPGGQAPAGEGQGEGRVAGRSLGGLRGWSQCGRLIESLGPGRPAPVASGAGMRPSDDRSGGTLGRGPGPDVRGDSRLCLHPHVHPWVMPLTSRGNLIFPKCLRQR